MCVSENSDCDTLDTQQRVTAGVETYVRIKTTNWFYECKLSRPRHDHLLPVGESGAFHQRSFGQLSAFNHDITSLHDNKQSEM